VYGAGEAMDGMLGADAGAVADAIKRPAVIVKMMRVILLAPVLIVLAGVLSQRGHGAGAVRSRITIPLFPFLFLAVIGLNSLELLPLWAVDFIRSLSTFMLTMAMTALGVETGIEKFRKAGVKPFLLALFLFIWLIFGGYWLVKGISAICSPG